VRIGTVALLTLTVVTLAGCGSGRLSHGKYVEQANAICSQYNASVRKLGRASTLIEIEASARRAARLYRTGLAQLEALRPAKEDAATVATLLATDRRVASDIDAVEAAARSRRIPAVQLASAKVRAESRRSYSLARLLGLTDCVPRNR
jgi:hypothetical protein